MNTTKWALKYDMAAQDFLGEDERVLAAVQCARGGGWRVLGASQLSGGLAMWAILRGKKRAGGFPQQFILAVTERDVVAMAMPKVSSGLTPRAVKELARWSRADVSVSITGSRLPTMSEIVIESHDGALHVECQGPKGELSERVVRAAAREYAAAA
jgi:hypothetical protein